MICRQSCEQPSGAARIERVPQAESERDSGQSDSYKNDACLSDSYQGTALAVPLEFVRKLWL
jgi:hypothetical protein